MVIYGVLEMVAGVTLKSSTNEALVPSSETTGGDLVFLQRKGVF